jgi:hypothetical protein
MVFNRVLRRGENGGFSQRVAAVTVRLVAGCADFARSRSIGARRFDLLCVGNHDGANEPRAQMSRAVIERVRQQSADNQQRYSDKISSRHTLVK